MACLSLCAVSTRKAAAAAIPSIVGIGSLQALHPGEAVAGSQAEHQNEQ